MVDTITLKQDDLHDLFVKAINRGHDLLSTNIANGVADELIYDAVSIQRKYNDVSCESERKDS